MKNQSFTTFCRQGSRITLVLLLSFGCVDTSGFADENEAPFTQTRDDASPQDDSKTLTVRLGEDGSLQVDGKTATVAQILKRVEQNDQVRILSHDLRNVPQKNRTALETLATALTEKKIDFSVAVLQKGGAPEASAPGLNATQSASQSVQKTFPLKHATLAQISELLTKLKLGMALPSVEGTAWLDFSPADTATVEKLVRLLDDANDDSADSQEVYQKQLDEFVKELAAARRPPLDDDSDIPQTDLNAAGTVEELPAKTSSPTVADPPPLPTLTDIQNENHFDWLVLRDGQIVVVAPVQPRPDTLQKIADETRQLQQATGTPAELKAGKQRLEELKWLNVFLPGDSRNEYKLPVSKIKEIRLFEDLVRLSAERNLTNGRFGDAAELLQFLDGNNRETRTFKVKHGDADEMGKTVRAIYRADILDVNRETGVLTLSFHPSRRDQIVELIEKLDRPDATKAKSIAEQQAFRNSFLERMRNRNSQSDMPRTALVARPEIPAGLRAANVEVTAKGDIVAVSPGDHVDLMLLRPRTNSESGLETASPIVVMSDLVVYATNDDFSTDGTNVSKSISLVMTPEQAGLVPFFQSAGLLYPVIRPLSAATPRTPQRSREEWERILAGELGDESLTDPLIGRWVQEADSANPTGRWWPYIGILDARFMKDKADLIFTGTTASQYGRTATWQRDDSGIPPSLIFTLPNGDNQVADYQLSGDHLFLRVNGATMHYTRSTLKRSSENLIPPGMRVATLKLTGEQVDLPVKSGTRVDVLLTTQVNGRATRTITIMEYVEVFSIVERPDLGPDTTTRHLSVLVSPEQASILTLAGKHGQLSIVLRSSLTVTTGSVISQEQLREFLEDDDKKSNAQAGASMVDAETLSELHQKLTTESSRLEAQRTKAEADLRFAEDASVKAALAYRKADADVKKVFSSIGMQILEQRQNELEAAVQKAFDAKWTLQDIRLKLAEADVRELQTMHQRRKTLSKKIIDRRLQELKSGDETAWTQAQSSRSETTLRSNAPSRDTSVSEKSVARDSINSVGSPVRKETLQILQTADSNGRVHLMFKPGPHSDFDALKKGTKVAVAQVLQPDSNGGMRFRLLTNDAQLMSLSHDSLGPEANKIVVLIVDQAVVNNLRTAEKQGTLEVYAADKWDKSQAAGGQAIGGARTLNGADNEQGPELSPRFFSSPQATLAWWLQAGKEKRFADYLSIITDEGIAELTSMCLFSATALKGTMLAAADANEDVAPGLTDPNLQSHRGILLLVERCRKIEPSPRALTAINRLMNPDSDSGEDKLPPQSDTSLLSDAADAIEDQRSFVLQMMTLQSNLWDSAPDPSATKYDWQISGDLAIATGVGADESKTPAKIKLIRNDGGWQVDSIFLVESLAGLASHSATPQFDTPQDLLDYITDAGRRKNYQAYVSTLTENGTEQFAGMLMYSVTTMSQMMSLAAAFGQTDPKQAAELRKLQTVAAVLAAAQKENPDPEAVAAFSKVKEGLMPLLMAQGAGMQIYDLGKTMRTATGVLKDKRQFCIDALRALEAFTDSPATPTPPGKTQWNVTISGDSATAKPVQQTGENSEPSTLTMIRIKNTWKIDSLFSEDQANSMFPKINTSASPAPYEDGK